MRLISKMINGQEKPVSGSDAKGSVSVVSGASDTFATILARLVAVMDFSRVTKDAKLVTENNSGLALIYYLGVDMSDIKYFYNTTSGSSEIASERIILNKSGTVSKYTQKVTADGFSSTNATTEPFTGQITLFY